MRLFSVMASSVLLSFSYRDEHIHQNISLDHDPDDSSIVRMRVTPPAPAGFDLSVLSAIEIEFDRNSRERSRRVWPMKYQAWDKRDPAIIEEELAKAKADEATPSEADEDETPNIPAAAAPKGRHGQGK